MNVKEKLLKIIHDPLYVGIGYLLLIPIFSLIYYMSPNYFTNSLTFVQSIYFSVITITTLGYGDISPITEQARVITSIEALLGIVVIGVFLNALTHSHSKLEENKKKKILQSHLLSSYKHLRERLLTHSVIIYSDAVTVYDWKKIIEEIKTGIDFREHFKEHDYYNKHQKRWDYVLSRIENDETVRNDLNRILDTFVRQVEYVLNNVTKFNSDSIDYLTGICISHYEYGNGISTYDVNINFTRKAFLIFNIMSWHQHSHYTLCGYDGVALEYDPIEKAIMEL